MNPNCIRINIVNHLLCEEERPHQGWHMHRHLKELVVCSKWCSCRQVYMQWVVNEVLCIFWNCQPLKVAFRRTLSRSARKPLQNQSFPHFVRLPVDSGLPTNVPISDFPQYRRRMNQTFIGLFAGADCSGAMCEGYCSLPYDSRIFFCVCTKPPWNRLRNKIIIL